MNLLPEPCRPPWSIPLGMPRLAVLCGLFLANYFFPGVLAGAGVAPVSTAFPWVCLGGTVLFLLAALQVCASAGPLPEGLGLRRISRRFFVRLPLWILLIFVAGGVAGGLWTGLLTLLRYNAEQQELQVLLRAFQGNLARTGFFLQIAVVVPALEELVFRRGIYEFLKPLGPVAALLGTAAIFSGVHLYLPGTVTLFCYGIGFQLAFLRSGSLVAPWLLHGALNAITFFLIVCG